MKVTGPLDERGKHRLVLKLLTKLRCPKCGQSYNLRDFTLVDMVACSCRYRRVCAVSVEKETLLISFFLLKSERIGKLFDLLVIL